MTGKASKIRNLGIALCLGAMVFTISGSLWAGDLVVDELTVVEDAKFHGEVVVSAQVPNPTNGLKLYYSFDNDDATNVYDSSGNNFTGYKVGSVSTQAGVNGSCAAFSSRLTYIVSPTNALNMNGWTEATVSAWINPNSLTTYSVVCGRGGVTNGDYGAFLLRTPGYYAYPGAEVYVLTNTSSFTSLCVTDADKPAAGEWHHYAFTFEPNLVSLYIDGVVVSQAVVIATSLVDPAGTQFVIGNEAKTPFINWGDQYFNGKVDELRIYNRALSEAEVRWLAMAYTTNSGGGSMAVDSLTSSGAIEQLNPSSTNILMGRLGIGTSAPESQLHVAGNLRVEGNIELNGNWLSGDGGDEGIYVDATGNVGVGVSSPTENLHVAGEGQFDAGIVYVKKLSDIEMGVYTNNP